MNNQAGSAPSQRSGQSQWDRIASSAEFKNLLRVKKMFIIPAFGFFFLYYFGLAVLVGYAPKLASMRVLGTVTVAYLFALSQFAVGWIVAALYLFASAKFDALTKHILAQAAADLVVDVDKDRRQGDH
jgi:uncharacterized membrane protein (DUF485 family)